MRMRAAIAATMMIVMTSVARAQQFDQANAANWYRVAITRSDAILASFSPEERSHRLRRLAVYAAAPGEDPPPDVRDLLARLEPALRVVYRATSAPSCNFELAEPPGLERALPHSASLRRFMHCLTAHAMVRFHAGDGAGGSESLAASYRLAAHAGGDGLLLGALYGSSLFKLADRVTQHAIDRGRIDVSGSTAILDALGRIDPERPFEIAEALEVEPIILADWWRMSFADDAGVRRFLDKHGERLGDSAQQAAFATMRQNAIEADLEAYAAAAGRAAEAFALDDVEEARMVLGDMDRGIRRGEHGVFARLLEPSLPDLYGRHLRMIELLDRRVGVLSAIAEGRTMPEDAANAAVWYLRAIEQYHGMEPADRRLVDEFAQHPAPPVAERLPGALERAQPVIELLRRATALPRCDFSDERPARPEGVASYHAPLRRLVELLHADALYAIQRDDLDAVVDRFSMCFRLAGHMSADAVIVSSLLADVVFTATLSKAEPGIQADRFTIDQRMRLLSAARNVGYRDPFGYGRAIDAERDGLKAWIVASTQSPPPVSAFEVGQALRRCDGDQVLFLAVAVDQMSGDRSEATRAERDGVFVSRWRSLDGVVSFHHLALAREKVSRVRELIDDRRIGALVRPIAPKIGDVAARRAAAQDRVSAALLTLRGEGGDSSAEAAEAAGAGGNQSW